VLGITDADLLERWLSQRLSHILGRGDSDDGVCAGVVGAPILSFGYFPWLKR